MSHLPTLGGPSSPPIPFPAAASNHLKIVGCRPRPIARGTVSQHVSIVYNGPDVEVLCPRTGSRLAAWSFAVDDERRGGVKSAPRNDSDVFGPSAATEVTCVAELSLQSHRRPGVSYARRFVVAGTSNGIVGVIDIKSSQLIRVVKLQHRVTSVAVVTNGSKASSDHGASTSRFFPDELQVFEGIIAVGTQEGHLYLLDAAIDLPDTDENEKNPALPHFFPKRSKCTDLAQLRPVIHQRGERLCFELNVESFAGTKKIFEYFSVITRETTYFPLDSVVVSSLLHVPQLGGLLVGFNFGSWQLFNLSTLKLEFSSAYEGSETASFTLPVTEFAFSEPENDPRNFCYVWVVRSEADFDSVEEKIEGLKSKATVSLYALAFQNRDEFYGNFYSGLMSCLLRFDHTLAGDPLASTENQTVGSVCLSAVTIGSSDAVAIVADEAETSDDADQDLLLNKKAITMFLWEVIFSSKQGSSTLSKFYLGIFDLNAWYQAQMPIVVEREPGSQCSFFSFCSLDDLKSSIEDEASQMVNIFVDVSTLSRFNNASTITTASTPSIASKPEQFFYPSSFMFEFCVAFDNCFVHANHLGLQRRVLLELQSQGKSSLVEPDDLYQLCVIAGLIVNPGTTIQQDSASDEMSGEEVAVDEGVSSDEKRSHLFNVALQNNLFNLLTGCLTYWSDGKFIEAGCTIKFIVDWAWTSVANIKQSVDVASVSLFDCSGHDLTEEERKSILQLSQQLNLLNTLLKKAYEIIADAHRWQNFDFDELALKIDLSSLIKVYVEAILWFVNAGLLPESSEDSGFSVFPAQHLSKVYAEKRERMKQQLQQWRRNGWIDSEAEPSLLLIDNICQAFGKQFKTNMEREGGHGLYPPPSFHAVLLTYLIHRVDKANDEQPDILKHRFVQYLFLDLASCLTSNGGNSPNHSVIDTLVKFPSAFGVPPSLIKLTQAFWLVDHEDFDDAMSMLLDPLVSSNDISDVEHRSILTAFLIQDQPKLALKYLQMKQPPQKDLTDTQIHISVLLANDKIHESFQHLRRRRSDQQNDAKLLRFFFNRCDAAGKLSGILQLPLTTSEERQLIDFLSTSQQTHRQETLLIYLLQRSRYSEAIALNSRLERAGSSGGKTRQAIMNRFSHLVPKFGLEDVTLASKWPGMAAPLTQKHVAAFVASKSSPKPTFQSSLAFKKLGEPRQWASNEFTPFRPRGQRRRFDDFDDVDEQPEEAPRSPSPKPTPTRNQSSILSILTTPQIDRWPTSTLRHSIAGSIDRRSATPQSILKVKMAQRLSARSPTSSQRQVDLEATEEEDDDNWLMKHRRTSTASRESTPGKSLRFNVPKKLPPSDVITPEQTIYEQSPEISPEKSLSTAAVESEKSKLEFVEPENEESNIFDNDDESIELVYSDEEEVDEVKQSVAEPEVSQQADVELCEELEVVVDADTKANYSEFEDEDKDVSFRSADGGDPPLHQFLAPNVTFNIHQQTVFDDVDFARELASQDSEVSTSDTTPVSSSISITHESKAGDENPIAHRISAPDVTFNIHQQTVFDDVDFARELASQDSEVSMSEATPVSTSISITHESKASDVTFYGRDESKPPNVDFAAGLARKDSETTLPKASPEKSKLEKQKAELSVRARNVSFYGHQETLLGDNSFIQSLAESDATKKVTVEKSLVDTRVVKDVKAAAKHGQHASSSSAASLGNTSITFGIGDTTIPVDDSVVRLLAEADAEEVVMPDETIRKSSDLSFLQSVQSSLETSASIFSFAAPSVISASPEVTASERSTSEFKFEEPLQISNEIPKLVFDDTADETCLDVSRQPEAPPATPVSAKRRKPRFSESFAGSASQLAPILENAEATVGPPLQTIVMKEERFRLKGRVRSTSDSLASPSVSGRRKSSQSASDVSSFAPEVRGAPMFSDSVKNVESREADDVKSIIVETAEEMTVSVHDEVEAHIISADESMIQAELVDFGREPEAAKPCAEISEAVSQEEPESEKIATDQVVHEDVETQPETSHAEKQQIGHAVDQISKEKQEPETPSVPHVETNPEEEKRTPRVTRRSTASSSVESTPAIARATRERRKASTSDSEPEGRKSTTPSRRSKKSGETIPEESEKEEDDPQHKISVEVKSSPPTVISETRPGITVSVSEQNNLKATSSSMIESSPKTGGATRRQKKTSSSDPQSESLSRSSRRSKTAEKDATLAQLASAGPEYQEEVNVTQQKVDDATETPRATRRSSASATLEPPLRVTRGRKKPSTTESESEVQISANPAGTAEATEVAEEVFSKSIRSGQTPLIEGVRPLRRASASSEKKAPTPGRRLRKSSSVAQEQEPVQAEEVVVEKRKRSATDSSPSPLRKSSRLESARKDNSVVADSPKLKTPEKKSAATPQSEVRSTRKSSATAPSPVPKQSSARKRSRTLSACSDAGESEAEGVSQVAASPSIRTPSRRANTTAMSVTKLSPIPENSLKSDAGNAEAGKALPTATPATARRTRRASYKTETPVKSPSEPDTKKSRASGSERFSPDADVEPLLEPTRRTRSTPTISLPRKLLVIKDPFSPIDIKLDEDAEEEVKPKKKYVTRKTAKSYKI